MRIAGIERWKVFSTKDGKVGIGPSGANAGSFYYFTPEQADLFAYAMMGAAKQISESTKEPKP